MVRAARRRAPAIGQHVRHHRDDRPRHLPPRHDGRFKCRTGECDRQSDSRLASLCARRRLAARSRRPPRRTLRRRGRTRARLLEPTRPDGRTLPSRPVRRRAGRASLPHGRLGAPRARRRPRVFGPRRRSGEGSRIPHRTGGDQCGARAASVRPGECRSGEGGCAGRKAAGGLQRL